LAFRQKLNAGSACLCEFHWRPESGIVLVHPNEPGVSNDNLALYLEGLLDFDKAGTETDMSFCRIFSLQRQVCLA
jgi:hypothetical protein